jgi:hypothetical protein
MIKTGQTNSCSAEAQRKINVRRCAALPMLAACLAFSHAQPAAVAGNEAADRLWRSFLEQYKVESLKPLEDTALDTKAPAAAIQTDRPKFRSWKPNDQPGFLDMVGAMTAKDGSISQFDRIEETITALLPQINLQDERAASAAEFPIASLKEGLPDKGRLQDLR